MEYPRCGNMDRKCHRNNHEQKIASGIKTIVEPLHRDTFSIGKAMFFRCSKSFVCKFSYCLSLLCLLSTSTSPKNERKISFILLCLEYTVFHIEKLCSEVYWIFSLPLLVALFVSIILFLIEFDNE